MEHRKLSFNNFPRIIFAHGYKATSTVWALFNSPNTIEITYLEQGNMIIHSDPPVEYVAPCICICFHDRELKVESTSPCHQHFTVAFAIDNIPTKITPKEIITNEINMSGLIKSETLTAILPVYIPDGPICNQLSKKIKSIISLFSGYNPGARLDTMKIMIDILYDITRYSTNSVREESTPNNISSGVPYCKKAIRYINEHLSDKISVKAISEELNISYGHLSRIFKECMNISLVEYINRVKLETIKNLILSKNITLEEAGRHVGIHDTKYLSRIFKKYNGITIREYRLTHNNYLES